MSLSLLISTIEKEVDKTEKKINEIIAKSNNISKIYIDIEEYALLESSLEFYISSNIGGNGQININDNINNIYQESNQLEYNNIYNNKKALKILRKHLLDKFILNDKKRISFLHKLNQIIYLDGLADNINPKEKIINLGKNKSLEENQNINFYNTICNIFIQNNDSILIDKLIINDINAKKINKIPKFILYDFHELIKQKIYIEWSLNYRVLLKDIILSNINEPDFKYIYKLYQDFFNDRLTLFDNKYLFETSETNNKFKTLLFNAIFLSNSKMINASSNQKIFFNNVTRYLLLFGFDKNKCRFSKIISNAMKNSTNEIKDKTFKELLNLIYYEKKGNIFMFIIWCLSMIFNHILIYDESENKISFSPYLNCSARAKNFFYNFLKKLDNYIFYFNISFHNSAIEYNAQIENYVFAELTKSYTKVLYDEQNKYKINLTGKRIFKLIQKLCKSGVKNAKKGENILDDIEDEEMYVDELEEESFENGPLDELESSQIYNLYFQFMKKHIILEKQNINELSIKGKEILNFIFCNKIENEDNKEINFEIKNTKIKLNYNNDLLIPVDILNSATQIMICISGDNQDINGNYKIFNQIINQRHFENVDYYIYKWSSPEIYAQNENVMKENIAKIYGKLLAYIIASKQIFKFQTISFLVIGMGNIILNSCLEELSTKINSIIDITDLIQDITLIDSNNELNLDIPQNFINMKLVAGKIINIYKKSEAKIEIPLNLSIRKSYSIIGINQNNDKIEDKDYFINCLPDIYNFDLINDLHISEKDYIFDINYILKKAKEKIYENY
jgi:hypothetical protein